MSIPNRCPECRLETVDQVVGHDHYWYECTACYWRSEPTNINKIQGIRVVPLSKIRHRTIEKYGTKGDI